MRKFNILVDNYNFNFNKYIKLYNNKLLFEQKPFIQYKKASESIERAAAKIKHVYTPLSSIKEDRLDFFLEPVVSERFNFSEIYRNIVNRLLSTGKSDEYDEIFDKINDDIDRFLTDKSIITYINDDNELKLNIVVFREIYGIFDILKNKIESMLKNINYLKAFLDKEYSMLYGTKEIKNFNNFYLQDIKVELDKYESSYINKLHELFNVLEIINKRNNSLKELKDNEIESITSEYIKSLKSIINEVKYIINNITVTQSEDFKEYVKKYDSNYIIKEKFNEIVKSERLHSLRKKLEQQKQLKEYFKQNNKWFRIILREIISIKGLNKKIEDSEKDYFYKLIEKYNSYNRFILYFINNGISNSKIPDRIDFSFFDNKVNIFNTGENKKYNLYFKSGNLDNDKFELYYNDLIKDYKDKIEDVSFYEKIIPPQSSEQKDFIPPIDILEFITATTETYGKLDVFNELKNLSINYNNNLIYMDIISKNLSRKYELLYEMVLTIHEIKTYLSLFDKNRLQHLKLVDNNYIYGSIKEIKNDIFPLVFSQYIEQILKPLVKKSNRLIDFKYRKKLYEKIIDIMHVKETMSDRMKKRYDKEVVENKAKDKEYTIYDFMIGSSFKKPEADELYDVYDVDNIIEYLDYIKSIMSGFLSLKDPNIKKIYDKFNNKTLFFKLSANVDNIIIDSIDALYDPHPDVLHYRRMPYYNDEYLSDSRNDLFILRNKIRNILDKDIYDFNNLIKLISNILDKHTLEFFGSVEKDIFFNLYKSINETVKKFIKDLKINDSLKEFISKQIFSRETLISKYTSKQKIILILKKLDVIYTSDEYKDIINNIFFVKLYTQLKDLIEDFVKEIKNA